MIDLLNFVAILYDNEINFLYFFRISDPIIFFESSQASEQCSLVCKCIEKKELLIDFF